MGFIAGMMLTFMTVAGIYYFLKDPAYRSKIGREFNDDPVAFLFAIFGASVCLAFLWGILIRPFGDIVIPIGRKGLYLWQFAGLCCTPSASNRNHSAPNQICPPAAMR